MLSSGRTAVIIKAVQKSRDKFQKYNNSIHFFDGLIVLVTIDENSLDVARRLNDSVFAAKRDYTNINKSESAPQKTILFGANLVVYRSFVIQRKRKNARTTPDRMSVLLLNLRLFLNIFCTSEFRRLTSTTKHAACCCFLKRGFHPQT